MHQELFRGSIHSFVLINTVLFKEASTFIQFWIPDCKGHRLLPCFLTRAGLDPCFENVSLQNVCSSELKLHSRISDIQQCITESTVKGVNLPVNQQELPGVNGLWITPEMFRLHSRKHGNEGTVRATVPFLMRGNEFQSCQSFYTERILELNIQIILPSQPFPSNAQYSLPESFHEYLLWLQHIY